MRSRKRQIARDVAKGALSAGALSAGVDTGIIGARQLYRKLRGKGAPPKGRFFSPRYFRHLPRNAAIWGVAGGALAALPHVLKRGARKPR